MCQALVLGRLDCLFTLCSTKTETLAVVREFTFLTGKSNGSETFFTLLLYKLFKFSYFLEFFGFTEVYKTSRLLQIVLFLIDSVFYVLIAYFDESMGSIGGYEPW